MENKARIGLIILFSVFLITYTDVSGENCNPVAEGKQVLRNTDKNEDAFSAIMARVAARHKNADIRIVEKNVVSLLSSIDEMGAFPDIDYSNTHQTNWQPQRHLDRINTLAVAYTQENNKYRSDGQVYTAIEKALEYWYKVHPRSTNWYMQQIASPQKMGVILILMRTGDRQLPGELEQKLLARMKDEGGNPGRFTGANKVDVATHWIYRGCLSHDSETLSYGANEAFSPLSFTTKEGFQHDLSYHQHGSQLYVGGYGAVIVGGIADLALYTQGTPYAISQDKLQFLSDFVIEGYLPSVRGRYFLYTALGRGLSRRNALAHSGFSGVVNKLMILDHSREEEYGDAVKRLRGEEEPGFGLHDRHWHYWRSDYTLHQRPSYTVGLRMSSEYVARNENGNGENLKGYFLSDGGMDIAIEGGEYNEIFPVWDWARIPGVTAPVVEDIPKPKAWQYMGTSLFTGGVSDGKYGVTAFLHDDNDFGLHIKAKKAWFFFDDEIVCLGAGISSSSPYPVNTTINQCLLKGTAVINKNKKDIRQEEGYNSYNDVSWIIHNNAAYYFPEKENIHVSSQKQSGTWESINNNLPGNTVSKEVFKLWIDHGISPENDSYSYIILPNRKSSAEVEQHPLKNIRILRNDGTMQVVNHAGLDITGIVFYEGGAYKVNGITVKADKGCILMIKNVNAGEAELYVAEPTQKEEIVTVDLQFGNSGQSQEIECRFPVRPDPYAGATQKYIVRK